MGASATENSDHIAHSLLKFLFSFAPFIRIRLGVLGHSPVSQESRTTGNRVSGRGYLWKIGTAVQEVESQVKYAEAA